MLDFGNASSSSMRRQREVPRATLESPLARGLWGEGSQAPHQSRLPPKALAQPGGCRVVFQPLFPHRADGSTGAGEPRGRASPPRFPRLSTHLPRCAMPGSPHQLRGIYLCFQPWPQHQGKQEWQVSRDIKGQHQNQGDGRQQPHSFFSELVPQHFSQPCVGARTPQGDQGDLEDMGGLVLNFSGSQRSSAQRSS